MGIKMLDVPRTTDTILMVRPHDFGFNTETGIDNEFQVMPDLSKEEINQKANFEFQTMVDTLKKEGVNVLILEKNETCPMKIPDAVFPNNWFSTEHDGTILTYPMAASNRRLERRPADLERLLKENGYTVRNHINVGGINESDAFLEGTGSMIIDHRAEIVYAARSKRCSDVQFDNFIRLRFYKKGILFDTLSSTGKPVYHTNVIMSIGEKYAVICLECILDSPEKQVVVKNLKASFEVIEISMEQMEKHFCGNILQVNSVRGDPLIVMSKRAFKGFNIAQIKRLEVYGRIVPVDIDIIETVGGGSARCMMAEIFSEKGKNIKT